MKKKNTVLIRNEKYERKLHRKKREKLQNYEKMKNCINKIINSIPVEFVERWKKITKRKVGIKSPPKTYKEKD